MKFAKYHALGNDYLVIDGNDRAADVSPSAVRRICDRHFGIGSDGILVRESSAARNEFRLRIFNPDGTEAEKSGNGLRIFARYLWDHCLVGETPFMVTTPGGAVRCQVIEQGRTVRVEMGQVRFGSQDVPVLGLDREVLRETLVVNGQTLEYSAATIGNPHCVIQRQHVSEVEARSIGPFVESEGRFPNRTNVQFMEILDRQNIRIEIWERGAGYTLASGSSSCAAAAVAKKLGLCDSSITVHMPGGSLAIEIDESFFVRMTGPVAKIAEGYLSDEILGLDGSNYGVSAEGIADPNDGIESCIEEWQRRRNVLLEELKGFAAIPPQGGWSLLMDVSPLGLDGAAASKRLLERGKIAATPMTNWGTAPSSNYVRFVFANEPAERLRGVRERARQALT